MKQFHVLFLPHWVLKLKVQFGKWYPYSLSYFNFSLSMLCQKELGYYPLGQKSLLFRTLSPSTLGQKSWKRSKLNPSKDESKGRESHRGCHPTREVANKLERNATRCLFFSLNEPLLNTLPCARNLI